MWTTGETILLRNDAQSNLLCPSAITVSVPGCSINRGKLVSLQYLLYRILANIDFLNSALAKQSGMTLGIKNIPSQSARMAMCILAILR